ncbi:MAG: hypothetical protein H5T36_01190 [Methanobacteriaceae archaeon]|nr:hypothetical protein [Methanobacteriaceae archaeon]
MDQRGVLSVDFLIATLILLITVSSLVVFATKGMDVGETTEFSKAKMIGENVARNINMVYAQGPGDQLKITLPGDFQYNITIQEMNGKAIIVVKYKDKEAKTYLIPKADQINKITMYPNKTYTISNDNGIIKITQG